MLIHSQNYSGQSSALHFSSTFLGKGKGPRRGRIKSERIKGGWTSSPLPAHHENSGEFHCPSGCRSHRRTASGTAARGWNRFPRALHTRLPERSRNRVPASSTASRRMRVCEVLHAGQVAVIRHGVPPRNQGCQRVSRHHVRSCPIGLSWTS